MARKRLVDCDRRLTRYRAPLDSGADPSVTAWITEVQAERLAAEVELSRASGPRNVRLSRNQLAALVNGLGPLLVVLAHTAPEDKAEVHERLGLRRSTTTLVGASCPSSRASKTRGRKSVSENDRSHTPTGRRGCLRGQESVSEGRSVLDAHGGAADGAGAGQLSGFTVSGPARVPRRAGRSSPVAQARPPM